MEIAGAIALLVGAVGLLSALASRSGLPAPLVLVVAGVAASYVPGIPQYALVPEVVLVGILPPLLYAAAIRTSLIDVRRDRRAIGLLSVGLVVFTCVVVGYVTWWMLPVVPLAAAFALGAVIAPPDAVAATAIARRVGMPRRMVNILEGESLVNDAIALVALSTAIAALTTTVTVARVGLQAGVAVVGGIAVGAVAALIISAIRRRVDDAVLDTIISLLAPFVAYLLAEKLSIAGAHGSGVLAVVVTGALLAARSREVQSASARISERINWRTIQFVLENGVFLLIGLQVREIVDGLSGSALSHWRIAAVCLIILVTTIISRFVWVFPATYLPRLIPAVRRSDPVPSWQQPFVVSWAGMRGVVTLAAVFALPADVPERPVLVLAALTVVGGTLLVQGSTLPALVRRLRLEGPDPAVDALAEAAALQEASQAGLARLDELSEGVAPDVLTRLRDRTVDRANMSWERLGRADGVETPSETYRRLRLEMLGAERDALHERRSGRLLEEDQLRDLQYLLDIEESQLDRLLPLVDATRGPTLRGRAAAACDHIGIEWPYPDVLEPPVCERCIEEDLQWVHLRSCLACGNIACCDSSPGRHATAHFTDDKHPVMRSAEPGEAWRWCFVDEVVG